MATAKKAKVEPEQTPAPETTPAPEQTPAQGSQPKRAVPLWQVLTPIRLGVVDEKGNRKSIHYTPGQAIQLPDEQAEALRLRGAVVGITFSEE